MTSNNTSSLLLALPEDVQRRLLAGCRYEDLFSLAAACRALRDVVNDPKFQRVRQSHGFIERGVVLVGTRRDNAVDIRSARMRAVKVSITGGLQLNGDTTTDGRRLFVSCNNVVSDDQVFVYALDVISRQWSRFATLLFNRAMSCMQWHAGRLYVAGGVDFRFRQSFRVYNEATRSWDALPDLPFGCCGASSGVIGDQLLIAGGDGTYTSLQIFDFTTGSWRVGPPLPQGRDYVVSVVLEGKLFVSPGRWLSSGPMLIYDPQSDAWTWEQLPFSGKWKCACVHYGRIIAFVHNTYVGREGYAYERAHDGSWSTYSCTAHARDALETEDDNGNLDDRWGKTRVESILLG